MQIMTINEEQPTPIRCKSCKAVPYMKATKDCISRETVLSLPRNTIRSMTGEIVEENIDVSLIKALPSVKSKVDVDSLIQKIEMDLSMYDDWGNSTGLHERLVHIIREWTESEG